MAYTVKILSISQVTHNVRCIRLEKPAGYRFIPGQATEVSINKKGWDNEKRPFTFTCLNDDPYLEFTIKCYNDHDGVTKQIGLLNEGDELIIDDPWGVIEYKGPGYFIAGGAGITPFIAILRQLHKEDEMAGNRLFFSNKTSDDIIYEEELKLMLSDHAIFVVTEESGEGYPKGYIDERFLVENVEDFKKHFYICGPDPMIKAINDIVVGKGASADAVVFEK